MSIYTTEVRYICERAAGYTESQGYMKIDEILSEAALKVFDFDFPIFDENYRKPLIIKILRHFYTREICEETVGLWKLRVEDRLNRIMPLYNQFYKSELLKIDPLVDTDLRRTHTLTKEEQGESSSNVNNEGASTLAGSNKTKDLYSDTPQGSLQNVENQEYLTNARFTEDETSQSSTNTSAGTEKGTHFVNSTDEFIENLVGKSSGVSYSKMLMDFRDTFLNIDEQIIQNLNDLFMLIW